MIKLKTKIGKTELTYEGSDLKSIMKFSALIAGLPRVCDACGKDDIYLSHKAPQGNDYYLVKCKDCGAELTFHQKKEGGFYTKWDEKMQVYKKSENESAAVNEAREEFENAPEPDVEF